MRPQDMSMQDPESLMYQILRLKEEIDDVASKLNEINGVFGTRFFTYSFLVVCNVLRSGESKC
jgi:hypothetical protein